MDEQTVHVQRIVTKKIKGKVTLVNGSLIQIKGLQETIQIDLKNTKIEKISVQGKVTKLRDLMAKEIELYVTLPRLTKITGNLLGQDKGILFVEEAGSTHLIIDGYVTEKKVEKKPEENVEPKEEPEIEESNPENKITDEELFKC